MILLGVGFVIMYIVHKVNFKYFSRLSQLAVWVSAILLFVTLLIGTSTNSATRWIFGFQPSDLAKLSLLIYVGRMLSMNAEHIKDFKKGVLPILIPIGVICALILPADFSTAAMLFATCMVLLFIGRVQVRHLFGIAGAAVLGLGLLILISFAQPKLLPRLSTWMSRITTHTSAEASMDSDKNYQVNIAKDGIKAGGLVGRGPGKGLAKDRLPSAWADFIMVTLVEEYGSIIGGLGIILAFLILMFRVMRIALKSESKFGAYIVMGLGFSIVFQAFINMGVAVNLLPVTGQTLPMISMGGTSLWLTCASLGVILSVSKSVMDNNEEGGGYEPA